MREDVQLSRVVDLQSTHYPEERPAGGVMRAVCRFDRLPERRAARAIDHGIQNLHEREAAAAERLDHLLRRIGEHPEHEAPHVLEGDIAESRTDGGARG